MSVVDATVFLGGSLRPNELLDQAVKDATLENAARIIRGFRHLQVIARMTGACALVVRGPRHDLERMRAQLQSLGLGDVAFDDPIRPFIGN